MLSLLNSTSFAVRRLGAITDPAATAARSIPSPLGEAVPCRHLGRKALRKKMKSKRLLHPKPESEIPVGWGGGTYEYPSESKLEEIQNRFREMRRREKEDFEAFKAQQHENAERERLRAEEFSLIPRKNHVGRSLLTKNQSDLHVSDSERELLQELDPGVDGQMGADGMSQTERDYKQYLQQMFPEQFGGRQPWSPPSALPSSEPVSSSGSVAREAFAASPGTAASSRARSAGIKHLDPAEVDRRVAADFVAQTEKKATEELPNRYKIQKPNTNLEKIATAMDTFMFAGNMGKVMERELLFLDRLEVEEKVKLLVGDRQERCSFSELERADGRWSAFKSNVDRIRLFFFSPMRLLISARNPNARRQRTDACTKRTAPRSK
jgi:hypothetical protein